MFKPSRKALFAVDAVLDIALNGTAKPVRSQDITRRQGIPRRYLEQALQHLARDGILAGVRGPQGGYILGRDRGAISVGDIMRSIRALEEATEKSSERGGSRVLRHIVVPIIDSYQAEMAARLDELSIDDLCLQANKAGLNAEPDQPVDFVI